MPDDGDRFGIKQIVNKEREKMNERKIKNPILPGFYPDPSICRVGNDFYMVCSSFELYPGIPIFHSKDLAHWEQIGHVMDKQNGFHVKANTFTGGVMAPTIRYHDGIFYVINTNYSDKGNYIVTAENPAGPWSKSHWLPDVPGIDASLFIEEDGHAYILGTGNVVRRENNQMDRGIYICDFDLKQMQVTSQPVAIWDSALRVASSPEAPHLYKVGEFYYLLIAEGGTEHHHAVTVARSRELKGWYEGNPANPIMTHRQFGYHCELTNVGHADLVDTPDGNWYAVLLGSRTIEGNAALDFEQKDGNLSTSLRGKNLGRETYICPVIWEREWPIFSPESGRIEWEYEADDMLPWTEYERQAELDHFDEESLSPLWCFWGTPYGDFWKLKDSYLTLKCLPRKINEKLICLLDESKNSRTDDCVSFVGRRQTDLSFEVSCQMKFEPKGNDTAGLVILQASNHHYRVERAMAEGVQILRLVLSESRMTVPPHFPEFDSRTRECVLAVVPYSQKTVVIRVDANKQCYHFYYGKDEDSMVCLYEQADGRAINPEIVGCMTGTMIGMYASGNGKCSENEAKFDWFRYHAI